MRVSSRQIGLAAVLGANLLAAGPALAEVPVIARVDVSDQRMYVYVENRLTYTWPVSTGRRAYDTPPGLYQPQWMVPMWHSRKYNFAPMPFAVFFHGGYAVHGTTAVNDLGRPASHGCVRLLTANAKTFFKLVADYGMTSTMITVVD